MSGERAPLPPPRAPSFTIRSAFRVSFSQASLIGRGIFASVYRARRIIDGDVAAADANTDPSGRVAIKTIVFDDASKFGESAKKRAYYTEADAFNRILMLASAALPSSLVTCYETGIATYPRTAFSAGYIVLEELPPVTLERVVQARAAEGLSMSVAEVLHCLDQVLRAVFTLHAFGIAHRDIKAANITYDVQAGSCKLFDLGLSFKTRVPVDCTAGCPAKERAFDWVGTPLYMPAEVVNGTHTHDPFAADMWAIGNLLVEMVTGKPWFNNVRNLTDLRHMLNVTQPDATRIAGIAAEPVYTVMAAVTLRYNAAERTNISTLQRFVSENAARRPWSATSTSSMLTLQLDDCGCPDCMDVVEPPSVSVL